MEGSEDKREDAAAAAAASGDEKPPSKTTSPSTTQDNLSQSAGSRLSTGSKLSAGSRHSGGSRVSNGGPRPASGAAAGKTEEDEEEEETKDIAEKEEEAKLVPKSKSKDSVKREEIEMNDHKVAPPMAAPLPTATSGGATAAQGNAQGQTSETHDVEVGKQNGVAHPEKVDAGKKTLVQLMKKKEMVICFIGGVTFLIGLIMIIIGLMVMQSKCDRHLLGSDMSSNGHGHHNGHHGSHHQDPEVHNRHHHNNNHQHGVEVPYVLHGGNRTEESHHHGNLAKDKIAFQSSTWLAVDGSPLNASLAVDGIHSNKANKGHCAQTESQSRPLWYVDLETMHHVKRVKVVIPGDCCIGELHDFEVRVGPNEDLELNTLCKHFMGTALKVSINIECDMDVYGRYVSIQMLGDDARPRDRLTLCEVMVYSK